MQKLLPQIKPENFIKFLSSREFIVTATATIATPLILKAVEKLRQKIPFLKDHLTIGMFVAAFVVLSISYMLKGTLQVIALGVAAGLAITAISPFIEDALNEVTN